TEDVGSSSLSRPTTLPPQFSSTNATCADGDEGFMRLMSRDCLRGLWHQQGKALDTTKPLTKVKGCCGRRNFAPEILSDFRPQSSG
ncbi:hypothetical protein, partial [Sulfitobacter pontiacus]|uniref:hypothetical protein n=1 Tax=Sulfitobacter pontiacus TaxID=60137 RepID=UPI00241F4E37